MLRAVPKTAGQPVGEGLGAGMPSSGILVINLSERGASSPQQASRRRLCLWGASTKSRGDTHFQVIWKVCEVFFCVCDVKFSPTVSEAVSGSIYCKSTGILKTTKSEHFEGHIIQIDFPNSGSITFTMTETDLSACECENPISPVSQPLRQTERLHGHDTIIDHRVAVGRPAGLP